VCKCVLYYLQQVSNQLQLTNISNVIPNLVPLGLPCNLVGGVHNVVDIWSYICGVLSRFACLLSW
jgi:hypothetical protein